MLLDLHTHSIASGHETSDTITQMVKTAAGRGLKFLGISDHGPAMKGAATESYFRNLSLAPKIREHICVFYGVELNILDQNGTVDLNSNILSRLDYAIASMHPTLLKPGSLLENTYSYIEAMKNPYINIIGHCDDTAYPVDYEALMQCAKEYEVFLEINESSLSPNGYRGNTLENNSEILHYAKRYQHPVLLSSDSHGSQRIGDVTYAENLVKRSDFPRELILNEHPEYLWK